MSSQGRTRLEADLRHALTDLDTDDLSTTTIPVEAVRSLLLDSLELARQARLAVAAWSRDFDCSATPGHPGMGKAVARLATAARGSVK